MLTLYHHGSSACAAKVRFALEEKALPWESRYVDIMRGEQFAPEYRALFGAGTGGAFALYRHEHDHDHGHDHPQSGMGFELWLCPGER